MSRIRTLTAGLLMICVGLGLGLGAGAVQAQDIDQEFDVTAGQTLRVNSDAGSITVNTWDREQVRVQVFNSDDFEMTLERSSDGVLVRAESERRGWFGGGGGSIRFEIDVPVIFNVDLDTGGGSIRVAPIRGDVIADTSGGRIVIEEVTGGDVTADTSGGRIDIGNVDGDVYADTSGGAINIGDVTGEVEADTSGGSITIGNVQGDMLAETSGGSITVGEGGGRVELDTSGGTIRAAWAMGPIIADTSGGNIYLAGSDVRVEADTSGGNIEIGASNGEVVADTSGGNIIIGPSIGPIQADTSGGQITAELAVFSGERDASIELESSGGDLTLRIPRSHAASVVADLEVSRRRRGDYSIVSDFPLDIQEDDDGNVLARGPINGGGDTIYLETNNSDIRILSIDD